MGKHRPTSGGTPAALLIAQHRPTPAETPTEVLPVFQEPHPPRLPVWAPWAAGLAVVGTVVTGVAVAPSFSGTASPASTATPFSPATLQPPTRSEAAEQLSMMAASRVSAEAEQSAAAEVQAASENAAAEALQEAADASAASLAAAEAAEAAQEPTLTPGEAVQPTGAAWITNSAGPVSARVQAAADAVVRDVPGADGITLGGTRSSAVDPDGHPSGNALDYMVGSDSALGDAIVAYHIDNWDALGVDYIIWQQQYLTSPGGTWVWMEDRGGTTANHYDHPHVNYLP